MERFTDKQKKELRQIGISLVLFVILMIALAAGCLLMLNYLVLWPLKDVMTVFGDGYDINPIGIFQAPISGIDVAIGQLHAVAAHRHPRFLNQIFRGERLPTQLLISTVFHLH